MLLLSAIAGVKLVLVDYWVEDTYSWYEEDEDSWSSVSLANEREVCDVETFSPFIYSTCRLVLVADGKRALDSDCHGGSHCSA